MADFKYKIDWIPDAKKLRQEKTEEAVPQGIASRPTPAQDKKEDVDFYTKMYEIMSSYFDTDEEAEQVLSSKKPDAAKAKQFTMEEFERMTEASADRGRAYREDKGITQSLVEGGGEAYRKKPPEGTITRPVARPDELVSDTAKDVEESAPVTAETEEETTPVATQGTGLMSPMLDGKDGKLRESYDELEMDAYLDEFIPEMAALEGLDGDEVLGELEPTYSYGITEEKANEYNMQPSDYDTMEEFARAFAARYRKEKEDLYPDVFTEDLNKDVERGLQSYLWNRGSFYPGQLGELENNNLNGFIDELKDVVNAADTGAANNQSRPMSGLSKRRAAEANLIGRGIEGYVPVATVETTGTQQKPIFIWKDARGNELNRFASNKPLHSMSTMGELAVTN